MAYRMTGKLVGKLWHDKPALGQYLDSLVNLITQPIGDQTRKLREWQNYVIEAMCALFRVGELLREQLTPEYIEELVKEHRRPDDIPPQFDAIAQYLMLQAFPNLVQQKTTGIKQVLNYFEIYCCNASVDNLEGIMNNKEVYAAFIDLMSDNARFSHYRIQFKRTLTAYALCCGRDQVAELMDNYDRDLYQLLGANEDIAELPFSERQKAISDLLSSVRNIFSRVNKISRKVKADGSPGKYEASQYLLVHRPVPIQLLS